MNQDEARLILKKLIASYVSDKPTRVRLEEMVDDKKLPRVPVRGVVDEIIKFKSSDLKEEDKNRIDDLMYFFG